MCYCVATISIVLLIICGVIVSLILIVYLIAISAVDINTTRDYHLTDNLILGYNSDTCQRIIARSTDFHSSSNATLYMLNSRPPLLGAENFNISETTTLEYDGDYSDWNFYLNAGSSVNIEVCLSSSSIYSSPSVSFYLVKGQSDLTSWIDDPTDAVYYVLTKQISSCTPIDYDVVEDDDYFFIVYSYDYTIPHVNVEFQFHRTVYHISQENVIQKCSFPLDGLSNCSVEVTFSSSEASSNTALLSLSTSLPVNYDDLGTIKINCQSRRWFYAVVVVGSLLPFIFCIVVILSCMCIRAMRSRSKYTQMTKENTTAPREVHGGFDVAPAANAPPPYNPAAVYPSYYEGYGAVSNSLIRPYGR